MICKEVVLLVDPYLDGELDRVQRRAMEDHLSRCPTCSRRIGFEANFNRILKERLIGAPTPPGVVARLRGSLADEDPARRGRVRRALLHPLTGYAAAATLVLALVFPIALGWIPGISAGLSSQSHYSTLTGMLICIECDRAHRTPAEQRLCRMFNHHTGLKTASGEVWSLVNRGAGADLSSRPDLRGYALQVRGQAFPEIRTLDVQEYSQV